MTLGKLYQSLFNIPSDATRSQVAPRLWPGRSARTTALVEVILKENNEKHAIFLGPENGFHNHVPHTVLAQWALGANDDTIKAAYEMSRTSLVPVPSEPSKLIITKENWKEHLGPAENHHSYFRFFAEELKTKCHYSMIEEYVTSPDANSAGAHMLDRVFAGLLHPMIHIGYGLEFNIPGVFIEGLAEAACRPITSTSQVEDKGETLTPSPETSTNAVGALSVLARLLKRSDLKFPETVEDTNMSIYRTTESQLGGQVKVLVAYQWDLSGSIDKAVEELIWTISLMYGVAGRFSSNAFNADFFIAHFVTSVLFVPIWIEKIKNLEEQKSFLRDYYTTCLTWYISRGSPSLDIRAFFSDPITQQGVQTNEPNPWLNITNRALSQEDEHTMKLQRSFIHFDELYGRVGKGYWKDTELEGAEEIDGTLFLRAAMLSTSRNNEAKKEEDIIHPQLAQSQIWDFRGFARNE